MHLRRSLFLCWASGLLTHTYPTQPETIICGTGPPSNGLRSAHHNLHALHRIHPRQAAPSPIVIDTYIHFVTTVNQLFDYNGSVVSTMIENQAAVLNRAYAPANITFRFLQPTYTINNDWATYIDAEGMKPTLRNGTYSALNLYFQTNLTAATNAPSTHNGFHSNMLGSCTFPTAQCNSPPCTTNPTSAPTWSPSSAPSSPVSYAIDGCHILATTMPGGSLKGYNLGGTAVHEVGHWFGLLHTFQGETCAASDPGDFIDDTKQEAAETAGCPVSKNSCPQVPGGDDPVWNYMDYSNDECYRGFTPEQNARMGSIFQLLRMGL